MNKQILQIAPTPFFSDRGCHIRIEGVIRGLTELGFDNTLCTYHHGRNVETVKTKRIKAIKNYTKTAAGPSKYKLWADWKLLLLCIQQYRQIKPMVIHAHLHEGLMIGLIVKGLFFWRGTPVIADMQGSLTGELEAHGVFEKRPYLNWPIKTLEWVLMKCATHIVCSSQQSLDKIKNTFSVNPNKISLAQDGADQVKPITESQKLDLLTQWDLPKDKIIVAYSGALLDSKGLKELKEIIKGADTQLIHFLIIGYPIENLEAYLSDQALHAQCTLTGQVAFEELSDYLSLADIGIDTKNNDAGEGSGKMLNYLACGLPVVAFNTVNNKIFLPEGSQLSDSIGQIIIQLITLAGDADLRKKVSAENLKKFETDYSWTVCKKQLNKVYQSI